VGVDMPPAPPEVSALVLVDQSALVPLPMAPAMDVGPPGQSAPFQAPEMYAKPQGCCWRFLACLKTLPFRYCETVARFPWAFLILYAVVVVIVISAGWQEVAVNTDIEAFREVAGDAATHHRSYNEALLFQNTVKDDGDLAHRKTFEVQLFYEAKKGSVFSESSLRDIRALENLLRNLKGWKSMCAMSDVNARFRCEPGESLGNYAWPGRKEVRAGEHTPFTLTFDGASRERLPVDAFLTYLSEGQPHDLRKFLPQQSGVSQADSTILRTIFAFTAPSLDDGTFTTAYKTFVEEELFSALQNATERAEEEPDDPWIEPWSVRVYFRGKEIQDHEVRYYLTGDLQFAIGALVMTFVITYLQLRSLFLASVGMLQVCMVPLMAFSVVGKQDLSLAGFLCIFLVIGLSSNDLLAIKEYWIRVGRECADEYPKTLTGIRYRDKGELDRYYAIRLSRTFQALLFRFLPQLMAMLSWLVMLRSVIRPIREFGIFMFACTVFACLLCVGVFPPLLVMHEAYIQPFIKKRMHRIVSMVLEPSALRFPWRPIVRQLLKLSTRRNARFVWAGVAAVVLVIILPWTIVKAVYSDNPGLPEVYSSGHHASVGRPLIAAFVPASPALVMASNNTMVCDPSASGGKGCGLHWCEAPKVTISSTPGVTTPAPGSRPNECICHRPSLASCANVDYINFTSSLSGDAFTKTSDVNRLSSLKEYAKATFRVPAASVSFPGSAGRLLSSLVMEHWESGVTNVEPMVEMPVGFIKMRATNFTPGRLNTCAFAQTCFCGARICVAGTGFVTEPSKIVLPAPTTPAPSRRLAERTTPVPSFKEVIVVFGITAPSGGGLLEGDTSWSRDKTFEPVSPWAQRSMLKMCSNVPSGFNVLTSNCWVQGFRTWMISQGQKFPTQRFGDFQAHLRRYLKEASGVPVTAMWLDAKGDMFATAFAFKVPPNLQASSADILSNRDKWLAYIKAENEDSATSASKAWATSSSWVDAEAQHEAYRNAWELAGIAISICVGACLLYTWDLAFTGIMILVSTVSMTVLAWFMFAWFQWAIGPWEVVLLVAYMMYTVEPALRVGRGAIWGDFLHVETRLAGNKVIKMNAVLKALHLPAPGSTPVEVLALTDDSQISREVTHKAPASETSSNDSPPHGREEVAEDSEHRKAFEARMHQYIMYVTNATFGSAAKLFLCGILALPCEFRLFTRMGAVTIMVSLISIPFTFILVPTALVLMPIREEPDVVTLVKSAIAKYHASRDP